MNRDMLLKNLMVLDFMAVDLALYLNTHPTDRDGIELYNSIIKEADTVRCQYEQLYGPLCSFRSLSSDPFSWIDCPWPWQRDFNFKLNKKECC